MHSALSRSLFVLVLSFALSQAAPQNAADTYTDPQGRFSVPVPTNWTVQEGDGFVTLQDPEGGLNAHLLVAPDGPLEPIIAQAWRRVEPEFALRPTDVLRPPSEPGVEATVVTNYESGRRVYQGFARRYGGEAFVLLIGGDLAAAQRRGAQLNVVASGFEISALEEADLTDAVPKPVDGAVVEQLEAFINNALARFNVPGMTVAVVQDGEIVYTGGFGFREIVGDVVMSPRMTPDTRMMIGSVGKSLTTMLMAALVDEGLVTWDTPAREVLPFAVADPELSRSITLRNLVCACTGVPRRDLELFFNANSLSAEGIVESLRTFEFFTGFGEAFQYSNQLVGTGGYAAAAADGAPYGELFAGYERSLKRRVLNPIGMESTTLSFAEVEAAGDAATPHTATFAGTYEPLPVATERLLRPIAPAGSHWSTAPDMARYLLTELAFGVAPSGVRVVSEKNLRTTWEPQVPVSADADYGLGWFVEDYRGLRLVHHGGNTLGFTADLAFLPQKGLGVVVLTNAQGTNALNEAVRERLFELVFDQEARAAEQIDFAVTQLRTGVARFERRLRELQPDAARPFVGRYRNDALGEVRLALGGDALTLDAGEFSTELRPVVNDAGEPDGYVFFDPPLAGVPIRLEQRAGEPTLVLGEGAVSYTFRRR